MKKIVTSLLFLLCSVLYAQKGGGDQESQGFDYTKELERQVKIPNTPEAQAFAKYGNTSVSMYSGTPNISVPIYTIAGREINVPLSLTYDASGIKVNQMATQAGLGWNLNAAGRISRTANGLVDDYISSSPGYLTLGNAHSTVGGSNIVGLSSGGSTEKTLKELVDMYKNSPTTFDELEDGKQYFNFLKDLADNRFDTQPDYFSFNALGYSDTFVYDPNTATFVALKNPRTKVTANYSSDGFSLESWVVTTDNGTKFYFEIAEVTHAQSNSEGVLSITLQDYNSSWVLTKIVSPHAKDEYLFDYENIAKTDQDSYHIGSASTTFKNIAATIAPVTTFSYVENRYEYDAKVLKKITHNGHEIVNINFKERVDQKLAEYDTNGSAIDFISIYKRHDTDTATPENDVLKQFQFHHSYFGISSSANPATYKNTPWMLRLKLDRIDIQSGTNSTLSSYHFDYISPESVPSRISLAQDYLGLYNGANNDILYVAVEGLDDYSPYKGANRDPNFNLAKIGTLSKITYPTGGATIFDYESHQVREYDSSTEEVLYGSLAINGIETNNSSCGNCCEDQYEGKKPNIVGTTFKITEGRSCLIDYNFTGGNGEAYLLKVAEEAKDNVSSIPYDDIIDQGSCNEIAEEILWNNFSNVRSVYLSPGTYQITLVKLEGAISLRVYGNEVNSGYTNSIKAGIRVKTIKDYSAENVLASEKEYKYVTALEESTRDASNEDDLIVVNGANESSGVELFKPNFSSSSYYRVYNQTPGPLGDVGWSLGRRVLRPTSFSGGDRPHVAYRRVFEIQKNGDGNNGYQVHDFNVGAYNGVNTDLGVSYYRSDFKVGKQRKLNVFNSQDELQTEEKSSYTDAEYFAYKTMYSHTKQENDFYYVRFYRDNNTEPYRYELVTPKLGDGFGSFTILPPDECKNPNGGDDNFCLSFHAKYSILSSKQTYAQGRTGGILNKESRQFYGDKITATETDYLYYTTGTNPNYLLKESKTITSVNDTLKQEFLYPDQLSEYNALVNANMLTNPVETNTYKASVPLSKQKTVYSGTLPSKVQTAKGGSDLEDRIFFERYANNNAVQVKQADGTTTAYIWGYWHSQPIAKIDNATYAQVENYVSNLQNLSNQDDDRTLGSVGNEGKLRTALNNLRNLQTLSNAQVTSYTYDPLIGVTSITDPRGNTAYYTYDAHHRLQFVKDKDGNILKENKYNYKN